MREVVNPLSWLPFHGESGSRRVAVVGGALVLSAALHLVLPTLRWNSAQAVSSEPISVLIAMPPLPLPEAEELNEALAEEDSPPEDAPDPAPSGKPAPPAPAAAPEAVPPPAPAAEPPAPPVEVATEAPADAVVLPKPLPLDPDARLAELERRRAERLARLDKLRALRDAQRAARDGQGGAGGKAGGAPPSGDWKTGEPDAVWFCTARDRGVEVKVSKQRPITEWMTIVPTVFAGFDTRPGMGPYLADTLQIMTRSRLPGVRRLGFLELALPNQVMQMPLDEPRGVKLAVGRLDARCLIGFRYGNKLFPITLTRVPMRIVDGSNNTVTAVADLTLYKDASIELKSADGTELPFTQGKLRNSRGIQANIEDHFEAARLARAVADIFGFELTPKRKAGPKVPRVPRPGQDHKGTAVTGAPPAPK